MDTVKVKFALIFLAIYFLLISSANAATIKAASCSTADIGSAIASASPGDTVAVPAGNCTWATQVNLGKEIKLIGAGIGNTNITCSNYRCIYSGTGSGTNVRVSGFTFTYTGGGDEIVVMNGTGWRVDHNQFRGATSGGDAVVARSNVSGMHPSGLVDNNQITNLKVVVLGSYAMLNENNQQHVLWAQNPDLGGGNSAVYVEHNTWTANVFGNAVDSDYGGRYVFRFNTINNNGSGANEGLYIEAHSVQGPNRASQRWEIYNNILNNTGGSIFEPFRMRGGTGVVFNNSIQGTWTYYEIALDNVRSERGETSIGSPPGWCDGTHAGWDQNTTGQTGYACRDQVGYGYDAVLWNHSPAGAWNQVKMPVYAWNNKKSDNTTELPFNQIGDDIGNAIQANRDYYNYNASFNGTTGMGIGTLTNRPSTCTAGVGYWATDQGSWNKSGSGGQGVLYKCTATNTWTLYYTPYTYPHPLQQTWNANFRIVQ